MKQKNDKIKQSTNEISLEQKLQQMDLNTLEANLGELQNKH